VTPHSYGVSLEQLIVDLRGHCASENRETT
jgi:hypothetical protein